MFKRPFSFEGRIRRLEYGLTYLIYLAGAVASSLLVEAAGGGAATGLNLVIMVPLIWFALAQGAKRCHDRGNSGWYQIIPFYGLWMIFAPGDAGENDYGPDPKTDSGSGGTTDPQVLDESFVGENTQA